MIIYYIYNHYSLLIFLSDYLFFKGSLYSLDIESFSYNTVFTIILILCFLFLFCVGCPIFPELSLTQSVLYLLLVVCVYAVVSSYIFTGLFLNFLLVSLVYWSVSLSLPVYCYYCALVLCLSKMNPRTINFSQKGHICLQTEYILSQWE